jgi:signal transduction histidine kinase/ActR/RegA family two-component response regulator
MPGVRPTGLLRTQTLLAMSRLVGYAWERTIYAGIAIAVLVLVAIAYLAYWSTDDLVETARLTTETNAVLDALDQVVGDLVDAETGQRGFLLTGDAAYLEPYHAASREIAADLSTLRAAAADAPARLDEIDRIEGLATIRMAGLSRTVELGERGDLDGALAALRSGRGKVTMDEIRALAADLRAQQQQILVNQTESVRANAARTTLSVILACGLAGVLILLSAVIVYREMAARRRINEELDKRVIQRTSDLRDANESLELEMAERQLAQEQLLEANLQLEQALDDVGQAHTAMLRQERLRALGELASGIAHDFNNALGMIVGFSELLLADPEAMTEADDARAKVRLIHSAAVGAGEVVSRLREFYRARDDSDDFTPFQVNDVIAQAISLTRPRWQDQVQAAGQMVTVAVELQDLPSVDGREAELREALANLILNAIDAMPNGGTLTLRSRAVGPDVVIEVSDTGTGMPAEVRERIFEPFYTTKGERGTGLGLAQVHRIVDRHHGEITVASAPGQGTTFTIRLPIGTRAALPAKGADESAQPRGLQVLLAEDEPSLRRILVSYLEIDHHQVTARPDGRQALAAFEPGRFDLLITDRAMPELNGDQLANEVSQHDPDLPIIMLTGLGDLMHELDERPPGVSIVIAKPVTLSAFRRAIVTAMSGEAIGAGPTSNDASTSTDGR